MSKLIITSIMFAMVIIPVLTSREKDLEQGIRKTVIHMMIFGLVYVFALRFFWRFG